MVMRPYYRSLRPFRLWRTLPHPTDWTTEFGRPAPLDLEIGCGNGDYVVARAAAHPERNLVGLELLWGRVQKILRRVARHQLAHVRVLQADARIAVERLFGRHSLHHVVALFPCPWPKARQEKHRLFSRAFLTMLNTRLVPQGTLHIVTDHEHFSAWLHAQIPAEGFEVASALIPPQFATRYEQRWHASGQERFYELKLRKTQELAWPAQEVIPMETHTIAQCEPAYFRPVGEREACHIEFGEFLYDPAHRKGLVAVVIVEEGLAQDLWIELAWQPTGWRIRPARGSQMLPTRGLQRALDLVRDAALASCAAVPMTGATDTADAESTGGQPCGRPLGGEVGALDASKTPSDLG